MVIYFKFGNNVGTSARAFSAFFLIFKTGHLLLFRTKHRISLQRIGKIHTDLTSAGAALWMSFLRDRKKLGKPFSTLCLHFLSVNGNDGACYKDRSARVWNRQRRTEEREGAWPEATGPTPVSRGGGDSPLPALPGERDGLRINECWHRKHFFLFRNDTNLLV